MYYEGETRVCNQHSKMGCLFTLQRLPKYSPMLNHIWGDCELCILLDIMASSQIHRENYIKNFEEISLFQNAKKLINSKTARKILLNKPLIFKLLRWLLK